MAARTEAEVEFDLEERARESMKKRYRMKKVFSEEDDFGSLFGDGVGSKLPKFANKITLKVIGRRDSLLRLGDSSLRIGTKVIL